MDSALRRQLSLRDKLYILLFLILFSASGVAAETSLIASGRANGIGQTIVLSNPMASEQLISGVLSNNNITLQADFGYQRKYNLKELDEIYTAFSYHFKSYTIVAGMSQLGDPDLYTQKEIRIGLLYSKSIFTIGNFITSESHDFNNRYKSLNQLSYSFSFTIKQKYFILSSVLENLDRPSLTETSPQDEVKLTMYGELLRANKYKTTLMFSTQKGKQNKFGVGETVEISQTASLMFGFSTVPTQFGGGIELKWKKNAVIYNSLYHPVLGLTHSVSFLMRIIDH